MPTRRTSPKRRKTSTSVSRRPPASPANDPGQRAVDFFAECLVDSKGAWAGQPFRLLPWQATLVRTIFGTRLPDTGLRQYRRVYICCGRKNGKSHLLAGLGVYLLLADHEPGAEIVSAAVDREQAGIVFALAWT